MLTRERAPEEELDAAPRWSLDHIDWSGIARARARDDPLLFFLVTAASFVETGADLYAANLASHVDDPVAKRWLEHRWQFEELRHGRALRKYVETVWPELDWARGYADFMAEYSAHCTLDALDGSRALEMVARCVVEVGTSTYYTALLRYAPEPVLGSLVRRIRQDEVRHYKRFRGFFESYRRKERIGRLAVLRKLLARLAEAQDLDAYVAFKHVWLMRHPRDEFPNPRFALFMREVHSVMRDRYPYRMAARMLLRPLRLAPALINLASPLLEGAARRLMFS